MNDTRNLPLELGFNRNNETVTAYSDEVFLSTASFAQAAQRFAETLFNRAMLTFHGTANAAKLRRGVIVEAAVRFDLATQVTKERDKIVVEKWGRKLLDTRPLVADTTGSGAEQIPPGSDSLNNFEEIADLGGFKGSSVDAGLVQKRGGIKEAVKLEAAAMR